LNQFSNIPDAILTDLSNIASSSKWRGYFTEIESITTLAVELKINLDIIELLTLETTLNKLKEIIGKIIQSNKESAKINALKAELQLILRNKNSYVLVPLVFGYAPTSSKPLLSEYELKYVKLVLPEVLSEKHTTQAKLIDNYNNHYGRLINQQGLRLLPLIPTIDRIRSDPKIVEDRIAIIKSDKIKEQGITRIAAKKEKLHIFLTLAMIILYCAAIYTGPSPILIIILFPFGMFASHFIAEALVGVIYRFKEPASVQPPHSNRSANSRSRSMRHNK
jgi:hypothetical protein